MIETLVPLKDIPPGLFTNGTMLDREGRWANGNLVRFNNNVPQAMGNWDVLSTTPAPPSGGTPGGAFFWTTAAGVPYVVCGKGSKLYVIRLNTIEPCPVTDITPAGMANLNGTANAWSFSHLDDVLLACRAGTTGDKLWSWDPGVGGVATQVANAPTLVRGVFVTPERFVVVLTTGGNIKWASQGTTTLWTPASTNSAGGLTIPSTVALSSGHKTRGQSLLLSEDDVISLDYVGAPLYYGYTILGVGKGALGPNVVSVVGDTVYWMGAGAFFQYDGYIQTLRCDVADTVFTTGTDTVSLAKGFGARFFSLVNASFNEIWWFYCSTSNVTTPNKLVTYNYVNNTWSLGDLARSAGCDALARDFNATGPTVPVLFDADGTTVYLHDTTGNSFGPVNVAPGAYLESGPYQINDGDQTALVQKLIPDGAATGDSITLFAGTDPQVAETTNGPYSVTAGSRIDTRFRARYVRLKQTFTAVTSRIGVPKLGIILSSKR